MKRSAQEVAYILTNIYSDSFGNDQFEPYRLAWSELRALTGVVKLESGFIAEINEALDVSQYAIVPFENFLVVIAESDFKLSRKLTGRLLEQYLPDEEDTIVKDNVDDDDIEDDEE